MPINMAVEEPGARLGVRLVRAFSRNSRWPPHVVGGEPDGNIVAGGSNADHVTPRGVYIVVVRLTRTTDDVENMLRLSR